MTLAELMSFKNLSPEIHRRLEGQMQWLFMRHGSWLDVRQELEELEEEPEEWPAEEAAEISRACEIERQGYLNASQEMATLMKSIGLDSLLWARQDERAIAMSLIGSEEDHVQWFEIDALVSNETAKIGDRSHTPALSALSPSN